MASQSNCYQKKIFGLMIAAVSFLFSEIAIAQAPTMTVSNGVVSMGIHPLIHGGAIDSLTVAGVETIDSSDQGRSIQASLFFSSGAEAYTPTCSGVEAPWYNPQESGDICGNVSPTYGGGIGGTSEANVGTNPLDWGGLGVKPVGIQIIGNHKIGPLPYANFNEAIRLYYTVQSNYSAIDPLHTVGATGNIATPVPFLPAIYFKGNVLTRLFGLSMDGQTWTEVTDNVHVATAGEYQPSLYRFRAMTWMRPDLGWGVALYGRWTLNQTCPTQYPSTIGSPASQCPNFVAQRFPSAQTASGTGGVNNLSIVDQTLAQIPAGGSTSVMPHLAVGNLDTLKFVINSIYNAGY